MPGTVPVRPPLGKWASGPRRGSLGMRPAIPGREWRAADRTRELGPEREIERRSAHPPWWRSGRRGSHGAGVVGVPLKRTSSGKSGLPESRKSGIPDFLRSGFSEIRNSGNPKFGNLEFRISGIPEIRISENPDFPIAKIRIPDFRKCGLRKSCKKCGLLEI